MTKVVWNVEVYCSVLDELRQRLPRKVCIIPCDDGGIFLSENKALLAEGLSVQIIHSRGIKWNVYNILMRWNKHIDKLVSYAEGLKGSLSNVAQRAQPVSARQRAPFDEKRRRKKKTPD